MKSVILFKKYKNTNNLLILFCICQLYLIENKVRNIAQIEIDESEEPYLKEMYKFLDGNRISFIKNEFGIVIGDKNNLIEIGIELEKNNYEKYAQNLGSFYKCAANEYGTGDMNHRIVIDCRITNDIGNFSFELFAQMCKKDVLQKNLSFTYSLVDDITRLFHKLDETIFISLQIYKPAKQPPPQNNPPKGQR